MNRLANLIIFFKSNKNNILLFLIVFLLCLLSFGAGILVEYGLQKPVLEIESAVGE